ncbi:MAG: AMP-dependent synthetase/ligase [Solirubrobacteraceae bacterium]
MATLDHTAEERSTHARTLGEMFRRSAERAADPVAGWPGSDQPALRWKKDGRWVDLTHRELGERATAIARGLIALGIERGERIAILSNTRPEWTVADAGVMCAGAATAPIYHTNSPEECEYVLSHSGSRLVFCEDPDQVAKVRAVRDHCPDLEHVVLLTGEDRDAITLAELCAAGAGVDAEAVARRVEEVEPGDLATLVYTSGTTGPPKACRLTHANWMSTAHLYEQVLDLETPPVIVFMFLPLAHSLARIIQMVTIDVGGTLAFWQRDPQRLLDDIREVGPTHLTSVPRVFEKIYTAASAGVAEQPAVKRAIFRWALATGREARARGEEEMGWLLRRRWQLADRLVLARIRALFGDRLRLAMSGAAPIAADVLEFFDASGVTILEGWGLSESTAAGTLNTVRARRIGSVGRPLPSVELRIADDGEILMRGPHVFDGYLHDPRATEQAFTDGWFRSGDIGAIQDGFLTITGRKKEIIITSSGKNVTPANIETALKESRWISEAIVYGDNRPYLVAVVTLDPEEAPALAAMAGVAPEPSTMATDERVRAIIGEVVDAANARFARIEQVKRFAILPHDLTQAGGELTPTLKVKRRVVYERYADDFEGLYE